MKNIKKVYGPYTRNDRRQHVVVVYSDLSKQTISYPKYLVEKEIGRTLNDNEEVHHLNNNFTDNRIENLKVVLKSEHMSYHAKYTDNIDAVCMNCRVSFKLTPKQQASRYKNRNRRSNGPFCSRKCSGIYSTRSKEC